MQAWIWVVRILAVILLTGGLPPKTDARFDPFVTEM
jgi:hypothetical protein